MAAPLSQPNSRELDRVLPPFRFQELSPPDLAVAFDPEIGDDLRLAVGLRLLHLDLMASVVGDRPDVDTAGIQRVVKELRLAVAKLEGIRTQHTAAINN